MPDYWTQEDLCQELKISKSTAIRWRKEGMPFIKINRAVRFSKSDVEKWLDEKRKN